METPPAQCHRLIPEELIQPVDGEAIPNFSEIDDLRSTGNFLEAARLEAKEWMKFALGQSARLEDANNDKPSIVHIVKNCEEMINATRPKGLFR